MNTLLFQIVEQMSSSVGQIRNAFPLNISATPRSIALMDPMKTIVVSIFWVTTFVYEIMSNIHLEQKKSPLIIRNWLM